MLLDRVISTTRPPPPPFIRWARVWKRVETEQVFSLLFLLQLNSPAVFLSLSVRTMKLVHLVRLQNVIKFLPKAKWRIKGRGMHRKFVLGTGCSPNMAVFMHAHNWSFCKSTVYHFCVVRVPNAINQTEESYWSRWKPFCSAPLRAFGKHNVGKRETPSSTTRTAATTTKAPTTFAGVRKMKKIISVDTKRQDDNTLETSASQRAPATKPGEASASKLFTGNLNGGTEQTTDYAGTRQQGEDGEEEGGTIGDDCQRSAERNIWSVFNPIWHSFPVKKPRLPRVVDEGADWAGTVGKPDKLKLFWGLKNLTNRTCVLKVRHTFCR